MTTTSIYAQDTPKQKKGDAQGKSPMFRMTAHERSLGPRMRHSYQHLVTVVSKNGLRMVDFRYGWYCTKLDFEAGRWWSLSSSCCWSWMTRRDPGRPGRRAWCCLWPWCPYAP